ncbi:UvrD-helicase domain-containing protein [Synechococcus sp. W2B2]|uniref:UvrD-helicase domain-containing protein n=1 Tax=Synechococcus sp. W2B2 TaxID=3392296 RepID=UPI0039EBAA22
MTGQGEARTIRFEPNRYPLTPGLRLLEASAGTGKTFALAHLVMRLVVERELKLDALLVVTFTEAAADELRDRIGKRLDGALQGLLRLEQGDDGGGTASDAVLLEWLEEHGRDRAGRRNKASLLLEALEALERADITTIHGFCRRTLRRQALESGRSLDLSLDDDPQTLVEEVAHDLWREQILTLDPGDVAGLLQAGLREDTLTAELLRLDGDCGVRIAEHAETINPEDALRDIFPLWLKQRWLHFHELWSSEGVELEQCLRDCAQEWHSLGCKDTKPYSRKPTKNRAALLSSWIETRNDTQSLPIRYEDVRSQAILGTFFHPGVFSKTARKCGETSPSLPRPELMQAIAALWDGPGEQTWRYLLMRGLREIDQRRQRRGVVGFSGLLDALNPTDPSRSQPWITALRARYKVALIDEFQDTDPLQWTLLRQTFASREHLLLMVGDPKQAIYRFRGGDLNTYKSARAQVDRIDDLLDNRRTTPPLMEAMNRLMSPGLKHSELAVPAVSAKASCTPLSLPAGEAPLQILAFNPEDAGGSRSRTDLEASIPCFAADLLLQILSNDTSLTPADLCILVSRHRQAEAIRDQLSRVGLPSRLISPGDVLSSRGAVELQWFLDGLARPADNERLRRLAAGALMQWPADTLEVCDRNGQLDQFAAKLQALADALPRLGVMGCLAQLLEGEALADLSTRGRLLGDLQQCARLVQDSMHRQGLNAAGGADWLRRQRLHPPDNVPEQRQPYSDLVASAVAVVTVHRSKGLQYPVVICPYLWEAPSPGKGPLWRLPAGDRSGSWRVALNPHWGSGHAAACADALDCMAEAERLAYVAVTRAERHLVLFSAGEANPSGNPLDPWLDARAGDDDPRISLHHPRSIPPDLRWSPSRQPQSLQCGPVPKEALDRSWGRSSYSAWIASASSPHQSNRNNPHELEEGRDVDAGTEAPSTSARDLGPDEVPDVQPSGEPLPRTGSLGTFPRGATAGDCLHRILEQIPFDQPIDQPSNHELVERELSRSGLDLTLKEDVLKAVNTVLRSPLGGPLDSLRLADLHSGRRLHELSFDLPVAHTGRAVRASALASAFRRDPHKRFGPDYAARLETLDIHSRGFLTGSIDLVFTDGDDLATARWWVADWKSNWIGERDGGGQPLYCGPRHYTQSAMEEQMLQHHYPLQAHLYLVALHRFLRWRLVDYSPDRHLGGYAYVFLRGVSERGGSGVILEPAPLQRLERLNQLLQGTQP